MAVVMGHPCMWVDVCNRMMYIFISTVSKMDHLRMKYKHDAHLETQSDNHLPSTTNLSGPVSQGHKNMGYYRPTCTGHVLPLGSHARSGTTNITGDEDSTRDKQGLIFITAHTPH